MLPSELLVSAGRGAESSKPVTGQRNREPSTGIRPNRGTQNVRLDLFDVNGCCEFTKKTFHIFFKAEAFVSYLASASVTWGWNLMRFR
jgi:hypothetical protein